MYIVNAKGDAFTIIPINVTGHVQSAVPSSGGTYYEVSFDDTISLSPYAMQSLSSLTAQNGTEGLINGSIQSDPLKGIQFNRYGGRQIEFISGDGSDWDAFWASNPEYFCFLKFASPVAGCTYGYAGGSSSGSITGCLAFTPNTFGSIQVYGADDPYTPTGGDSTGGVGGDGIHTDTSDTIAIPSDPILTAAAAGFITIYAPSLSQIQSLASYMWSGAFDIASFRKIFADPMDAILGLSIMPVAIPTSGASSVKVGNIDTGLSMNKASTQFITVNCGSLQVDELWGAYLDYDPYTKAEVFLPYIGNRALRVDDIMGKSVNITYKVDITSGACVCFISCGGSVLYSFQGQCGIQIPISRNDWSNVFRAGISIAGSIGATVATGGLAAPAAVSMVASTATNVMAMKPNVQKSGSLSGGGGMLGVQKPYLILTRPRQCKPAQQNTYTGYPLYTTETLSTLRGYTVIQDIHIEGVTGTQAEVDEIERLLKTGVIL